MSSSDAMFETFFSVFPVCKWASCSCKNRLAVILIKVDLGHSNFQNSPVVRWFSTTWGVMNENLKAFGVYG